MGSGSDRLRPLLLAGGQSSRMGAPKHLLQTPDDQPLYQRLLDLLRRVFPSPQKLYVSVAEDSTLDARLEELPSAVTVASETNHTRDEHGDEFDIIRLLDISGAACQGPSAGLLAAYHYDPEATWLVIGCDYPLLTPDTLRMLLDERGDAPVTCFRSQKGFLEPLVAVWTPMALECLKERVQRGDLSPSAAIRAAEGKALELPAGSEHWLMNVNTPEEWTNLTHTFEDLF